MAYTAPTERSDGYVVTADTYNVDLIRNIVALRTGGAGAVEQTTTATGAQNNFDLTGRWTYLRCTGAAPAFSGFTVAGTTPTAGDEVIIECLGTTSVKVDHQSSSSTAANRAICVSTNGLIVGVNGRLHGKYDGTTGRWRFSVIDPGAWITVAFSAGNFTATGGGSWTVASGDQTRYAYQVHGKTMRLSFSVLTSTVAGTVTSLNIAIPGGYTAAAINSGGYHLNDANTNYECGLWDMAASGTVVNLRRANAAGSNLSAAVNTTAVNGVIEFEVT